MQALLAGNVDVVAATRVNLVDDAPALTARRSWSTTPTTERLGWPAPTASGSSRPAELAQAFQAAVQSLIDDGTYTKILTKYGQEPIGVKKATIDQAID